MGPFNAERMLAFMESVMLDMRAMGHAGGLLSGETGFFTSAAEGASEWPLRATHERAPGGVSRHHGGLPLRPAAHGR
jgi:hypothetical protein